MSNTGNGLLPIQYQAIIWTHAGISITEIALLYEERRVASVVAIEVCDIYILSKHDFQEVLEDYPEMRSIMTRIARKRIRSIVMKHEG